MDSQGRIVRSEEGGAEGGGGDGDKDLMKALARSFKLFPYLVRRAYLSIKSRVLLTWEIIVFLAFVCVRDEGGVTGEGCGFSVASLL